MMTEAYELEADTVALEPLAKPRGSRGISAAMRAVFDVLYEADMPLDIDTIAERTFELVHPAVRYHARRAYVRRRRLRHGANGVTLEVAWRGHLGYIVGKAAVRGVLIRTGEQRRRHYAPNPARPPSVQQPDGSLIAYTRDAWTWMSESHRTIGDIQTMRMEAERLLGGLSKQELETVIELAILAFTGNTRHSRRPVDPRPLRVRLDWLLKRPTTDASRAWLLHELVHRTYGPPISDENSERLDN
jgi:hypothetical protein